MKTKCGGTACDWVKIIRLNVAQDVLTSVRNKRHKDSLIARNQNSLNIICRIYLVQPLFFIKTSFSSLLFVRDFVCKLRDFICQRKNIETVKGKILKIVHCQIYFFRGLTLGFFLNSVHFLY